MFVLLVLSFIARAFPSVSDCGQGTSIFQITELAFPSTLQAGSTANLTLQYMAPVQVDNGTITTKVTYNFIPLTPTTSLLCASAACPIEIGFHDGSTGVTVPTGLSGTIVSTIAWTDMTGSQLLCVKFSVKVTAQKRLGLA
jgi:hypothetical protein